MMFRNMLIAAAALALLTLCGCASKEGVPASSGDVPALILPGESSAPETIGQTTQGSDPDKAAFTAEDDLRYNVKSAIFHPFSHYRVDDVVLTAPEINALFDFLSELEFSEDNLLDYPLPGYGQGWGSGMLMIYTDSENYYLAFDSHGIAFYPGEDMTLENRKKCVSYGFTDDSTYSEVLNMLTELTEKREMNRITACGEELRYDIKSVRFTPYEEGSTVLTSAETNEVLDILSKLDFSDDKLTDTSSMLMGKTVRKLAIVTDSKEYYLSFEYPLIELRIMSDSEYEFRIYNFEDDPIYSELSVLLSEGFIGIYPDL